MTTHERVMSNLATHRRKIDLTQEALAQQIDVTRQTIISIEKGNYVPSVLLALKIAKVCKVSVEELFYYENN